MDNLKPEVNFLKWLVTLKPKEQSFAVICTMLFFSVGYNVKQASDSKSDHGRNLVGIVECEQRVSSAVLKAVTEQRDRDEVIMQRTRTADKRECELEKQQIYSMRISQLRNSNSKLEKVLK